MKKITLLCVVAGLCFYLTASAGNDTIQPLYIGDLLPEITFKNIYRKPTQQINLADYKDKVVVLDFFATWCSSCIAALPHLDALQKNMNERLKVFVITNEPQEKIERFFNVSPVAKKIRLSFVFNDRLLQQYFPYSDLPHEVILYKNKVVAITYPEYVTAGAINEIISKGKTNLPVKTFKTEVAVTNDILNEGSKNAVLKKSVITAYDPAYTFNNAKMLNTDTINSFRLLNAPIINLYKRSFLSSDQNYPVILEVANRDAFIISPRIGMREWGKQNVYGYEVSAKNSYTQVQLERFMADELDSFFGLKARITERAVSCYALQLVDSTLLAVSDKSHTPLVSLSAAEPIKKIINQPLSAFFQVYNTPQYPKLLPEILLDETNFKGNVSMHLDVDTIFDIIALGKAVKKYGLRIVPVVRELKVLIISDKKNKE